MFFKFKKLKTESKTIDNRNNKIILVDGDKEKTVSKILGINIEFTGENSTVKVHKDTLFEQCRFSVRSNVQITIGKSQHLIHNLRISSQNGMIMIVGKDFSCHGIYFECHDEIDKKIVIGDDCMCSHNILVRNSDGHTIFDEKTGEVLNYGKDLIIGNHVWIGTGVTILKGARIPDNTVVGACSLVTKSFSDSNIIIGGVPAKVLKTGTNWDRTNPQNHTKSQN